MDSEEMKSRMISKFALIGRWLSLYERHYKHKHNDAEIAAINASLTKYSEEQLEVAFKACFEASKYYPKLSEIIAHIPSSEDRDVAPWEKPWKFPPFKHQCCPRDTKIPYNGSFKMLEGINPYEASHIACPGPFTLRCPNCGTEVEGFTNPFIEMLMTLDRAGTKQWNSDHKGHTLCDGCATRLDAEWVEKPDGWARRA